LLGAIASGVIRCVVTDWGAATGCGVAGAVSSRAALSSVDACITGTSGGLSRCGEIAVLEIELLFGATETAPD
jgi:hypothetical protein